MADAPHKGIMLAERPAAQQLQYKAFLPAGAPEKMEPWGLNPAKKVHAAQTEEKAPGITVHYRKWLQELEGTQRDHRDAHISAAVEEQQKKEAVAAFGEKLRQTILNGGKVSEFWKAAGAADKPSSTTQPPTQPQPATTSASDDSSKHLLQGMDEFVDQVCSEATAALANTAKSPAAPAVRETAAEASTSAPAAKESRPGTSSSNRGKKAASKPAWALSEGEVSALQEDEELELLEFADNLDFDSFVGKLDDMELQDTFKALQEAEASQQGGAPGNDAAWRKSFVRALNHVAMARVRCQKQSDQDPDTASVAGQSEGAASRATHTSRARSEATAAKLSALAGKQRDDADDKWDSSSRVGPCDMKMQAAAGKLQAAEEFLLENPDLKGVHSNASVRAMLMKSEQQVAGVSVN